MERFALLPTLLRALVPPRTRRSSWAGRERSAPGHALEKEGSSGWWPSTVCRLGVLLLALSRTPRAGEGFRPLMSLMSSGQV